MYLHCEKKKVHAGSSVFDTTTTTTFLLQRHIKTADVKPRHLTRAGISISCVLCLSCHGRTTDEPVAGPQELDGVQFLMHSHLPILDGRIECERLYGLASRSIPSLTD